MKIVAVQGSPHKHGNTALVCSRVLDAARQAGATVEDLSLADYEVRPCRACNTCHRTGRCPIPDDFENIKAILEDADGIILTSPNYIFNVTAQMKAFLDRCCGLIHRQAWIGRYGAAVVTSGGGGHDEIGDYLQRFLRAMGCWTVGAVGAEAFRLADQDSRERILSAADALGRRLVESIRTHAAFPEQAAEIQAFGQRMRQLVALNAEDWTFEAEFWRSRGGLKAKGEP